MHCIQHSLSFQDEPSELFSAILQYTVFTHHVGQIPTTIVRNHRCEPIVC